MADPILIDAKVCTQCEVRKPFADFSPSRYMRSGRVSECRTCAAARQLARRGRLMSREVVAYPATKRCSRCREVQPASEYYVNHACVDGLGGQCRACVQERRRMRKYGLDDATWASLREADSSCAICKAAFDGTPNIDHCHATGRVRGLLCSSCNAALGHMRDTPKFLRAAADYLEERDGG